MFSIITQTRNREKVKNKKNGGFFHFSRLLRLLRIVFGGGRLLVVYVEQVGAADAQHVFDGPGALVDRDHGEVSGRHAVRFGPHAHGQRLEHHLGRPGLGVQVPFGAQARGSDGGRRRPAARQNGDGGSERGGRAHRARVPTAGIPKPTLRAPG